MKDTPRKMVCQVALSLLPQEISCAFFALQVVNYGPAHKTLDAPGKVFPNICLAEIRLPEAKNHQQHDRWRLRFGASRCCTPRIRGVAIFPPGSVNCVMSRSTAKNTGIKIEGSPALLVLAVCPVRLLYYTVTQRFDGCAAA